MAAVRGSELVVIVASVFLLAGCDAHRMQDDFADQAGRVPQGFTETTGDGEIVAPDNDDWRTSPLYRGRISIDPAFPNPASTSFVAIPMTVIGFEGVGGGGLSLRAYDPSGRNLIALAQTLIVSGPGSYSFNFSPGQLSTKGLHRVFIFDLNGEIVSYGDVMVE